MMMMKKLAKAPKPAQAQRASQWAHWQRRPRPQLRLRLLTSRLCQERQLR
jgi:hypothetical protein